MNILITTQCSKNCSFCFAQQKPQVAQVMSLATFRLLLDFIQRSQPIPFFKILGGEPTEHPEFVTFIQEIVARKLHFGLITNGLYTSSAITQVLESAIRNHWLDSVLINMAELDRKDNAQAVKDNYQMFLEQFKKIPGFVFNCSVTLNRQKNVEEELAYLRWLTDRFEIHALRISLDFSGNNRDETFFINNKTYGEKIIRIWKFCLEKEIKLSGDCIVYPCQFEDQFVFKKKLPVFLDNFRSLCHTGETVPFDVMPDLSYFHCYPARELSGRNLLEFSSYQEARNELVFRKQALYGQRKAPAICESCPEYHQGCDSLCLGCTRLDSALCTPVA